MRANDTVANFLFMNRAGKKFEEVGFISGVALGEGGKARSGMAVDSADVNQERFTNLPIRSLHHLA
jgi:enediyne biosynthesis protein E4